MCQRVPGLLHLPLCRSSGICLPLLGLGRHLRQVVKVLDVHTNAQGVGVEQHRPPVLVPLRPVHCRTGAH